MSFFEQYRMNMPIIAPSLALLTRWHMESLFVSERTWDTVLYGAPAAKSAVPRHADADEPFDPNDETSEAAVAWWLQWADYYVFPHVILFDSWAHLAEILRDVDLAAVSAAMREHNAREERDIVAAWRDVLGALPSRAARAASDAALAGKTFEERMDAIYGRGAWADY